MSRQKGIPHPEIALHLQQIGERFIKLLPWYHCASSKLRYIISVFWEFRSQIIWLTLRPISLWICCEKSLPEVFPRTDHRTYLQKFIHLLSWMDESKVSHFGGPPFHGMNFSRTAWVVPRVCTVGHAPLGSVFIRRPLSFTQSSRGSGLLLESDGWGQLGQADKNFCVV